MGVDGDAERAAELQPDRYYLLSDGGSFFFDPAGDNDGFESPEAAAEWARAQTTWPDLARDLRDGAAAVVLGAEWNANQEAQEAAEAAGFPEGWLERVPPVRNFARRWRLPRVVEEKLREDPGRTGAGDRARHRDVVGRVASSRRGCPRRRHGGRDAWLNST